jgi:hypothetical protein
MDPKWVSIFIGIVTGVVSAWITVEVRFAIIRTQLEEREKLHQQQRESLDRETEIKGKHQELLMGILNSEVVRVRNLYDDVRKMAEEASEYVKHLKRGREH